MQWFNCTVKCITHHILISQVYIWDWLIRFFSFLLYFLLSFNNLIAFWNSTKDSLVVLFSFIYHVLCYIFVSLLCVLFVNCANHLILKKNLFWPGASSGQFFLFPLDWKMWWIVTELTKRWSNIMETWYKSMKWLIQWPI